MYIQGHLFTSVLYIKINRPRCVIFPLLTSVIIHVNCYHIIIVIIIIAITFIIIEKLTDLKLQTMFRYGSQSFWTFLF